MVIVFVQSSSFDPQLHIIITMVDNQIRFLFIRFGVYYDLKCWLDLGVEFSEKTNWTTIPNDITTIIFVSPQIP